MHSVLQQRAKNEQIESALNEAVWLTHT
jgi:hypothetical protein